MCSVADQTNPGGRKEYHCSALSGIHGVPFARSILPLCLRWTLRDERFADDPGETRIPHPATHSQPTGVRTGVSVGTWIAYRSGIPHSVPGRDDHPGRRQPVEFRRVRGNRRRRRRTVGDHCALAEIKSLTPTADGLSRDQLPNQRCRRVAANSSFSAARSADGPRNGAVGAGPDKKSASTLPTKPPPNSM